VQRLGVVVAHLTQPYQPSPITLSGRPAHRPFRGPAQRSLALRPAHSRGHLYVTCYTEGFSHLLPHDCSGCFRLERLPGRACTHWKAPPLNGAHVKRTFRRPVQRSSGARGARACLVVETLRGTPGYARSPRKCAQKFAPRVSAEKAWPAAAARSCPAVLSMSIG
jgi:hypothetical protein